MTEKNSMGATFRVGASNYANKKIIMIFIGKRKYWKKKMGKWCVLMEK